MTAQLWALTAEKIRTQRILGQLIKEGQQKGELATRDDGYKYGTCTERAQVPKTLTDIGISRKDSSIFQTIASIPDEAFKTGGEGKAGEKK